MYQKKTASCLLASYAKINLYLEVLGKLAEGYHEIRTVFLEVDVADQIKYTLTNKQNIEVLANVETISNPANLAAQVATYLKDRFQVNQGLLIEMEKHIPIAAGMGGGSSDAASTIKACSNLWNLNLSFSEMQDIAALFGSDLNFFLQGGTALGTHRGEIISRLPDFVWEHILLVKPEFGVSAKDAYAVINYDGKAPDWQPIIQNRDVKHCFNRLQKGVVAQHPEIDFILQKMQMKGALQAIMTGSGSTCVGFFTDPGEISSSRDSTS
jgi:4-diphosphocytidyl-2-C-methyl-D-erythritol kinase